MNPRTVLWQAATTLALLCLTIAVASPDLAVGLAAVGLVMAAALNAGYAAALGDKGRSRRRIVGDHLVAAYAGAALLVPLVGAVIASFAGVRPTLTLWGFTHTEVEALLGAGDALFVAVLSSSLVDWYYIRPRIDGVVCAPPCRAKREDKPEWKRVTRRWYIHRGLATLAYILFAISVAFVVMIMLAREDPEVAAVLGGVSGFAGLLLIFVGPYRSELPTVGKWALSPSFVLGDDLTYAGSLREKRGYVLHVAVPVVKLVPLDDVGRPIGAPYVEPKNSDLSGAEPVGRPTTACEERCAGLNPECLCQEGDASERTDFNRRLLII